MEWVDFLAGGRDFIVSGMADSPLHSLLLFLLLDNDSSS